MIGKSDFEKLRLCHAINLKDFEAYCRLGGIPSREILSREEPDFTRFISDQLDRKKGYWNRIFVNFTDFGNLFGMFSHAIPNAYGPICILFNGRFMEESPNVLNQGIDFQLTSHSVSSPRCKQLPVQEWITFFQEKNERLCPKREYRAMEASFVLKEGVLEFKKANAYSIVVDEIEINGRTLFDAVSSLVDSLNIKVCRRNYSNNKDSCAVLKLLIEWAIQLSGKRVWDFEANQKLIPEKLKDWFKKTVKNDKSKATLLASWLEYTYNGTLRYLK